MSYSFNQDNLGCELTKDGMGAAFQGFMGELLAKEHNDITIYPTAGKDGAIDISREHDGGLVVYECKHIGDEDNKTALARWKGVAATLRKNITPPDEPPKGQSQYKPWYNTDKPIIKYKFCISPKLGNESNVQYLEKEIQIFFGEIAKKYNHLRHLSGLKINVFSMNHWEPVLRKYPNLILKWYPKLRPNGFSRFEDMQLEGTFRSYLCRGKLPHYSRKEHLERHASPENNLIQDEDAMIRQLEIKQATGLILTGTGGVGKSRLMIELGRLANESGWIVLRTTSERKIDQNIFSQLISYINPQTKVLFLIDYVETLENFQDFIETLTEHNVQSNSFFCYIGTCRSQYYTKMLQDTPGHNKIDLSPIDSTKQWFEEYRNHTVKHILKASGMEDIDKCRAICHGIPILAVFLSFLHSQNRDDDIGSLLQEQNFGRWVRKRLKMTMASMNVEQDDYILALLVAQFPMTSVDHLIGPDSKYTNLFRVLKKDGWVEEIQDSPDEDEQWVISHDVFADEIIISYLKDSGLSKQFFKTLFRESDSNNTLHSALVSTERIACHLDGLKSDDWYEIICKSIAEKPDRWKEIRNNLLMTSILDLEHSIRLLEQDEALWADAEKRPSFHGKLGWLVRQLRNNSELSLDCNRILSEWLKKAVPYNVEDNYLVNSGLRLCPEEYKDLVFNYICLHEFLFQTHFSIVCWLDEGLPLDSILEYIHKWLGRYPSAFQVSFIIKAWIKAGGDKEQIWPYLGSWLKVHGGDVKAQYVCSAWLNADGDKEQIWSYLKSWLKVHGRDENAQYVCSAWLKAGGDKEQIWPYLESWLKVHGEDEIAQYVCSAWLKAGGDKEQIWPYLGSWLKVHGGDVKAQYVCSAWLNADGDKEQIWSYLKSWLKVHGRDENAQYVYSAWLSAGGDKEQIWSYLESWLEKHREYKGSNNVYEAWLKSKGNIERIWPYCNSWLKTYCESENAHFLYETWIKVDGNKEKIWPYLERWLQQNCATGEACFLAEAWVEKGGDFDFFKEHILKGLKEFCEKEDCERTFNRWLIAGGDKEKIWPYIELWLKKYNFCECASRVFGCWLEADGDKDRIWPYLERWFKQNCKTENASFPIRVWDEKGGDFDLIKKYVFEWVKENSELEHCDFTLTKLLMKGGDSRQIWTYLKSWLERYGELETASYVYNAWLKKTNELDCIWPYIERWLTKNCETEGAIIFFRTWFSKVKKFDLIKNYLLKWIKEFHELDSCHLALNRWLGNNGDKKQIWPYLESWLKVYGGDEIAKNVYSAWINAGGETKQIRSYLYGWLEVHGGDENAQQVYSAWLNAKRDIGQTGVCANLLKKHSETENASFVYVSRSKSQNTRKQMFSYLESWLEMHCEAECARYVYLAWLNNRKDIDVVQEYISRWLKKYLSDNSIRRFVRFLAQVNPLPKGFVRDILCWCRNYPEDENSLWCITSLKNHLLNNEFRDAVVQTSEILVYASLSEDYNLTEVSVGQINTLFSFLISHKQMSKGQYFVRVNELFLKWLKCSDSYGYAPKPQKQIQRRNYFIRFKMMLHSGKLDILNDASVIERFLQWVNNWHASNKKLIQQDMNKIKDTHPKSPLWDIVKFAD